MCQDDFQLFALKNAIDEVGVVNNFQIFMDKLYTFYSKSTKDQHELAECGIELDQQANKMKEY